MCYCYQNNINETRQSTPINGPGERFKAIAVKKPTKEMVSPYPAERIMADLKLGA